MGSPRFNVFSSAEQVARDAAKRFVDLARPAIDARGRFAVVLAGGSTPQAMYRLLAEPPYRDQVDWPRVEVFWGDERTVPPDHPDSNFRMARRALLSQVPVLSSNVHRMKAEADDLEQAADAYQREIAQAFHVSPEGEPPVFDLLLLGMGADGHTASLFPHTAALRETSRWVAVNHVPGLGASRLTLTSPILNRAAHVLFLVTGAEKAPILADVLEGPADPHRLPAQTVRPTSGTILWLVDAPAAARLVNTHPPR
ncbi:MAG: 6-phosphogluconolactonase [Planctomycetes bacterium]|nr:6-phosphogluconolactonase [Planctomycetota bacterium]